MPGGGWAALMWVGVRDATSATKWFGLGRAEGEGGLWLDSLLCPGLSTPFPLTGTPLLTAPADLGLWQVPPGGHCWGLERWGSPRGHTPNTRNTSLCTSLCTSLLRTDLCPSQAAQSHSELHQDVPTLQAAGQHQGRHTRLLPAPSPSPMGQAQGHAKREAKGRKNSKGAGSSRHS